MELAEEAIERVSGDFASAALGDPRRRRRVMAVAARLARRPGVSLPKALESDAEVEGCYRLMKNPRVTFSALLQAHSKATALRAMQAAGPLIVVHDTTDADYAHLDASEIGYLQTGKAGFKIHLSLVLDASKWRLPLGIISGETIHRAKRSKHTGKKLSGQQTHDQDDKESARWWRGIETAGNALKDCPHVVHVADRESDSYELMERCIGAGHSFVFRARVSGRRGRVPSEQSFGWSTVDKIARSCEGMLRRDVPLSGRAPKTAPGMNRSNPPRSARTAELHFSATRVELPRPKYLADPIPTTLTLHLVHVVEHNAPEGTSPVQWLLYTTEPIDTPEQVARIVDIYRARWTIEEFNAALKTGCAYEARQFESRHALLNMLALSLPVACELLAVRSRSRDDQQAPASDVLRPTQIDVLRHFSKRHKLPTSPTIRDALLAIAGLGGHLKHNGEPGWKVLMSGMATLLDYEAGWLAALQATYPPPKLSRPPSDDL
jgi:hypothetical protein